MKTSHNISYNFDHEDHTQNRKLTIKSERLSCTYTGNISFDKHVFKEILNPGDTAGQQQQEAGKRYPYYIEQVVRLTIILCASYQLSPRFFPVAQWKGNPDCVLQHVSVIWPGTLEHGLYRGWCLRVGYTPHQKIFIPLPRPCNGVLSGSDNPLRTSSQYPFTVVRNYNNSNIISEVLAFPNVPSLQESRFRCIANEYGRKLKKGNCNNAWAKIAREF